MRTLSVARVWYVYKRLSHPLHPLAATTHQPSGGPPLPTLPANLIEHRSLPSAPGRPGPRQVIVLTPCPLRHVSPGWPRARRRNHHVIRDLVTTVPRGAVPAHNTISKLRKRETNRLTYFRGKDEARVQFEIQTFTVIVHSKKKSMRLTLGG